LTAWRGMLGGYPTGRISAKVQPVGGGRRKGDLPTRIRSAKEGRESTWQKGRTADAVFSEFREKQKTGCGENGPEREQTSIMETVAWNTQRTRLTPPRREKRGARREENRKNQKRTRTICPAITNKVPTATRGNYRSSTSGR